MGVPTCNGLPLLSFNSDRRFGVELELLAFDGKNRPEGGQQPKGIDYVAMVVSRHSPEPCEIRAWEHTNNNEGWVVKPDSSCGMEVCTPVYKGWQGLKRCCQVVEAFGRDAQIKVDNRCSVHVHIEVSDLDTQQIASVIAHWMKVEPVFMDSVPNNRKRNRYCQFMGMTSLLSHDTVMSAGDLIGRVGSVKYYSLNTNQMLKNGRKTIEFRIAEGEGVKDAYLVKNWVRLLIHFVERAAERPFPPPYKEGDAWSSYLWLDPIDTMTFLGFNESEYSLSPGLRQTRDWFLARLEKNMAKEENSPRSYARGELMEILRRRREAGDPIIPEKHLTPSDLKDALFNEELKA